MVFRYQNTTNRLFASRIIKFAVLAILILVLIQAAALAGAWWVIREIVQLPTGQPEKVDALQRIAELLLGFSAIGAIATIVTAVIARYGFREATQNIGQGLAKEGEGDA